MAIHTSPHTTMYTEAGRQVIRNMHRGMTPDKFRALIAQHPAYTFDNTDRLGNTALLKAVRHENIPLIRHIIRLAAGSQITIVNLIGNDTTALIEAAALDNQDTAYDIATILLKAGAKVNLCNEEGKSPLWQAANAGHARVVRLFLENDAVAARKIEQFILGAPFVGFRISTDALVAQMRRRAEVALQRYSWDARHLQMLVNAKVRSLQDLAAFKAYFNQLNSPDLPEALKEFIANSLNRL